MSEYSEIIGEVVGGRQQNAQQSVVGSIEDDPEKAARAVELSEASGVPPTVIYSDVDQFNKTYKAGLASSIVSKNQHIQDYIASHPMARAG